MKRLLFVCSGNTCRSPMAAAIAAAKLGTSFIVRSAGVDCDTGVRAARFAIQVMRERGLDISSHRSTDINELNLQEFDIVVAIGSTAARKLAALPTKQLQMWEIEDPYNATLEKYKVTADVIDHAVSKLVASIIRSNESTP